MKRIMLFLLCITVIITSCLSVRGGKKFTKEGRLIINGRELFLSGMNLAWIHFANDPVDFDEARFAEALDDVARAGGNCLRFWIHTNGSSNPRYDEFGKVLVLNPEVNVNLERALDLAWDRGILIVMCLWSHDMLTKNTNVDLIANQRMLEIPLYTEAYINKALIPMVSALKGHPAIACWEIINEPEGMLSGGWTTKRTEMIHLQRFINLTAGAIHREDPGALVTTGSGLAMTANAGGLINYYSDERLISAGGDELGTLDFYEAHYYPNNEDEMTSPFHHPASYWELDKPILIGEFPAGGIKELGKGFKPRTSLSPKEAYLYAYENGYAGALGWTWTAHDGFGGTDDAAPGMLALLEKYREYIAVDIGKNRPPLSMKTIDNLIVDIGTERYEDYVNVGGLFRDFEDGEKLDYSIGNITNPELLAASIDGNGNVDLTFFPEQNGLSYIEITAKDSAGAVGTASFIVIVHDPLHGNLALFKPAVSSSDEGEALAPRFLNDGLADTRWSSSWADDQWVYIDLGQVFSVGRIVLNWEVAFGLAYDIQVSRDAENWETVYHEDKSDGKIDEFSVGPKDARYVRMYGIKRATQWGFSLWEFEIYAAE
ncbi:MAG: discoidin domain-containing protein [Spirochaetales bacterium]|nr:discoidin domain-containing protein [Spirochaetales bacterium]